MSRLRKLSRAIYEQVKHLPWKTLREENRYQRGLIHSPEVTVNGREYNLQMELDWFILTVSVRVNGMALYPGGSYTVWWRWRWEKEVYRRVAHDRGWDVLIIPCDDVLDSDLAALSPKSEGSLGALSLTDEKVRLDPPSPE